MYTDIESLESKLVHTKIPEITLKVMTKTRVISTNKGNYQICTVKDWKGKKTSLNLYSKLINNVQVFGIYKFTNLRKGEILKNDELQMRFHTTNFTKLTEGTIDDTLNFKNVINGEVDHIQLTKIYKVLQPGCSKYSGPVYYHVHLPQTERYNL